MKILYLSNLLYFQSYIDDHVEDNSYSTKDQVLNDNTLKVKAYKEHFVKAMKTIKIDEGTYVSKFSLGDNQMN